MGGSGGMPVEASVARYIKVLKVLKREEYPQFVTWDGAVVPW